jgi:hypothetical protein
MRASTHQQQHKLWKLPSWKALLCLILLQLAGLCSWWKLAAAQQTMPFQGSGSEGEAPETPTPVYVSAVVDRLLQVDDQTYEFTASILFYLSWRDPRVKDQIAANTLKLQTDANYSCRVPCQSNNKIEAGGCCDGVWMPYIAFTNIKVLSEDRVVRWGLGFSAEGE